MKALPPINCAGCRKCCLGDTITLLPGDDPGRYKTKLVDGERVLRKKKDGNCVYLGSRGCTIYGSQPRMCRAFDCRVYALKVAAMPPSAQASRLQRPSVQEGFARLKLVGALSAS